MVQINTKTYIFTFIATIVVFVLAVFASTFLTRQKTDQLKADEDKIAIDIISLETQYDLLKESSCKTFDRQSLRQELDTLSSKLTFLEGQVGYTDPEVFRLKRYYSLLEIKDYILTKKMAMQCKLNTIFILYFYSNTNCPDCQTTEYMLRAIRNSYPEVEVYSFDHELDLSAVQTLISLHNIPAKPPVIDINDKVYSPFQSLDDLKSVIDSYLPKATTTAATSTKASLKSATN